MTPKLATLTMRELLNVLYVQTQGAVVRLDHDAAVVHREDAEPVRIPLLRLEGVTVFGRVTISPLLLARCAKDGRSIVWLERTGRFVGQLHGPTTGNVHLRRAQHAALDDETSALELARSFVAGKIQNSRLLLLRSRRDAEAASAPRLTKGIQALEASLRILPSLGTLDAVRGCEGAAAAAYFAALGAAIRSPDGAFVLDQRTRRPPRDRMNAVLSFLYGLLRSECVAALEGVGLDPQVGYLHGLRSGRPALALDLMEELRPVFADRLALTLVNRRQLQAADFDEFPGGAVALSEQGRRTVLEAWQERKKHETDHRVLERLMPLGLVPHVQGQLLARRLRGDLPVYLPYLHR